MKNIVILGSTGSIGTQSLEVISSLPDYQVLALSAHSSRKLFLQQIKKYQPQYIVLSAPQEAEKLNQQLTAVDCSPEIIPAQDGGLETLASLDEADLVINALVGAVGLKPTLACLKAGNLLGLANKESLVIGGDLIKRKYNSSAENILPIDSEHNALFQILENRKRKEIKKLYLTASGGPFLDYSLQKLKEVTVSQALNHPNWDMGPKITIDSATMMNKGLEVIEAHYLFGCPFDQIEVVVHPESIIHSLVEFIDNSIQAEMGAPDMRSPIQHVLTYPETRISCSQKLDLLEECPSLNFQAPDREKFPSLELAYQVGREGGTMPVVLNAANEVVVRAFLDKRITFTQISDIIKTVLSKHNKIDKPELEDILVVDRKARERTEEVISYD